jgi:putative PIN family toxin of toxin-antitoxin system
LIRVVLDTNVIVSGTISTGAPRAILDQWAYGAFELVVSPTLLRELSEVLTRPKLRDYVAEEDVRDLLNWIRRDAVILDDDPSAERIASDPSDDFLLALARRSGAAALISGDQALLRLQANEPPILSPRTFLDALSP